MTAVGISTVIGASLLIIGWNSSSPFVLGLTSSLLALVPALSLICAAVGCPVRRKARYVLSLLVFIVVFDLVAFASGWQRLSTEATSVAGAWDGIRIFGYRFVLAVAPFVTLILFAGKRPSMFWASEG